VNSSATPAAAEPRDVLGFWREAGPERWFKKDDAFDHAMTDRFLALHGEASAGALDHWSDEADGNLALILVLDQFSRNMFRGSPRAFAQDGKALQTADKAIRLGFDSRFEPGLRTFFYLPFEHSECLSDQHRCVRLIYSLGNLGYLDYAIVHRDIIRRFGRFPHRNAVLGRHSSPAEQAFLDEGGFSG
jgi:uncharacterized protein (DUF924 family)